MILLRTSTTPQSHRHTRRAAHAALCASALIAAATPSLSLGQSEQEPDDAPPLPTLHFTPVIEPAPVDLASVIRKPTDPAALIFEPGAIIDADGLAPDEHLAPLAMLAELMLIRAQSPESPPAESDDAVPDATEGFSLRFEDTPGEHSIWENNLAATGQPRWELLPDLFIRSGRVFDEGYESIDYADLYAELGVDLTSNSGIWLRYERLRQALGRGRVGEQVDADALFLQFELRF